MRPLANVLIESEMNHALEEASGDYLNNRVAAIMEKKLGQPTEDLATKRTATKKHKARK